MCDYLFKDARWLNQRVVFLACSILVSCYVFAVIMIFYASTSSERAVTIPFGWDFTSFWFAGRLALTNSVQTIYDFDAFGAYQQSFTFDENRFSFYYPPSWLLLVSPFSLLPFSISLCLFLVSTFIAGFSVCRVPKHLDLSLFVFLACPFVFLNISYGQNAFLSLALLAGGFVSLLDSRKVLAGVLFGLMTYKPQLGILIPVALVSGRYWKTIFAASATFFALFVLTSLLWGFDIWVAFLKQLSVASTRFDNGNVDLVHMASIKSILLLWGLGSTVALSVQIVFLIASVVSLIFLSLKSSDKELVFAFAICATTLATPVILQYDLVILGWPFSVVARRGIRDGFLSYEKFLLAFVFVLPLISRASSFEYHLHLTPLVPMVLAYFCFVRAMRPDRSSSLG